MASPYGITQVDIPGVLGGVQRMEHNALAARAMQEQMADRSAARQRQSALATALPSALSGDKEAMGQVAQLDPEMFMKLDDRQRAQAKDRAETMASLLLAAKNNPQSYPAIREQAINTLGLDPTKIPEQYDEGFIDAQAALVLDAGRLLDMMKPQSDIGKINQDVERGFVTPGQRDQKIGGNERYEPVYDGNGRVIGQRNLATGKVESDPRATQQAEKAPAGYRFKDDGSLEPIPGGPAEQKQDSRDRGLDRMKNNAQRIIGAVDKAIEQTEGFFASGFGSGATGMVRGSPATNLRATLETIKANLGFEELQAMREASPTGGALGQVAVQELIALQATVANLDPAQSDTQLRENLQRVKTHYQNWLNTVEQSGGAQGDTDALLQKYGIQ